MASWPRAEPGKGKGGPWALADGRYVIKAKIKKRFMLRKNLKAFLGFHLFIVHSGNFWKLREIHVFIC
jgi:hypothetical protein